MAFKNLSKQVLEEFSSAGRNRGTNENDGDDESLYVAQAYESFDVDSSEEQQDEALVLSEDDLAVGQEVVSWTTSNGDRLVADIDSPVCTKQADVAFDAKEMEFHVECDCLDPTTCPKCRGNGYWTDDSVPVVGNVYFTITGDSPVILDAAAVASNQRSAGGYSDLELAAREYVPSMYNTEWPYKGQLREFYQHLAAIVVCGFSYGALKALQLAVIAQRELDEKANQALCLEMKVLRWTWQSLRSKTQRDNVLARAYSIKQEQKALLLSRMTKRQSWAIKELFAAAKQAAYKANVRPVALTQEERDWVKFESLQAQWELSHAMRLVSMRNESMHGQSLAERLSVKEEVRNCSLHHVRKTCQPIVQRLRGEGMDIPSILNHPEVVAKRGELKHTTSRGVRHYIDADYGTVCSELRNFIGM